MKLRTCLLFLVFTTFFYSGCSKSDNATNPDKNDNSTNQIDQNSFLGLGSDYKPANSNQIIKGTVNGSVAYYDSLGTVTRTESGQGLEVEGAIGPAVQDRNKNVSSILFLDQKDKEYRLFGYLYNLGGVLGVDTVSDSKQLKGLLLPKEFKIGQEWTVDLLIYSKVPPFKVKAAEALGNYTTSSGKSFKDVVRLEVTFKDSSGFNYSYIDVREFKGDIYLAKGAGIIDVKVDNYTKTYTRWDYDFYTNKLKKQFYKKVARGTIGL
ncbi:MAG: hypothetical protein ACM3P0_17050 [Acidobacteriota bacterium]